MRPDIVYKSSCIIPRHLQLILWEKNKIKNGGGAKQLQYSETLYPSCIDFMFKTKIGSKLGNLANCQY